MAIKVTLLTEPSVASPSLSETGLSEDQDLKSSAPAQPEASASMPTAPQESIEVHVQETEPTLDENPVEVSEHETLKPAETEASEGSGDDIGHFGFGF